MVATSEIGWLEKVLAGHVANFFPEAEGDVVVETPLRAVLTSVELSEDEQFALDEWEEGLHSNRSVGDLLLEARINAAVRQQAEAMAQSLGIAEVPEVAPIQVVRGSEEQGDVGMAESLTAAGVLQPTEAGLSVSRLTAESTFLLTDGDGYDAIRKLSLDPNQTDFVEEGREAKLAAAHKALTIVQSMHGLDAVEDAIKQALPRFQELADKTPEELEERDLTGEVLGGKYRVKHRLGKGGFGTVYEAVDEMLGAPVAIKVLNPKAAGHDRALEQFLDEAKLLTNLDHPNIVRWITFDKRRDGQHYFVMEHLSGEELSEILKREGRLAPERVLSMLHDIVDALRAAHRLPDGSALYHLDLKPQNVFVVSGEPERIKVIDFGISQHVGAEAREAAGVAVMSAPDKPGQDLSATIASQITPSVASDTTTGIQRARGGTLLYASPEQCKHLAGHPDIVALDGRSDLYSVGVMAFQMLTGEIPFTNLRTPMDAIDAHLNRAPRKPSDLKVDVPKKLASFVARCLAKDRDDRFADADEAYAALDRIANPPSKWPWLSAAAGLVVIPSALWLAFNKPLEPFNIEDPDQRVYAGPALRSVDLPISGLEAEGTEVSFWSDIKGGEELLTDWRGEVSESGDITVHAPEELTEAIDEKVYVRLTGAGKKQSSSDPLRIVFLGEGSWSLEKAGVEGLLGKALDPTGAELEILLRAEPAAIEKVEVTFEGRPLRATPATARSLGTDLYYTLDLGQFGVTAAGPASFEVTATDRAGGRQTWEEVLDLASERLTIDELRLDGCVPNGVDGYLINPDSEPVLVIETNREAATPFEILDADNNRLLVESTDTDAGWALDFSGLTEGTPGSILVRADDSATTQHEQEERGKAAKTLTFRYERDLPRVQLSSSYDDIVLEGVEGYATNEPGFRLRLDREGIQVRAEVVLRARSTNQELPKEVVNLTTRSSDTASFTLPADGVYDLEAGLFRSGAKTAEEVLRRVVVLDRSRRQARIEGTSGVIFGSETEAELGAELLLSEPENTVALPMDVNWELRRSGSAPQRGTLSRLSASPDPIPLTWETLGIDDPATLADGSYELIVEGRDAAGNELEIQEAGYTFEVARQAPEITFVKPGTQVLWRPLEDNRFELVVEVSDPNGVEAVDGSVGLRDEARKAVRLTAPASGSQWSTTVDLPPKWSSKVLRVEITARDSHDVETTETIDVEVSAFELRRLEAIAVELRDAPGVPIGGMLLIEGVENYYFGGQGDSTEKKTFLEFGASADFFAGDRDESWEIRTPIEDFYLDENEVTVGEFLAFVEAPSGYGNSANWREGVSGSEERRQVLLKDLRGDADVPVTAVDWFEASAYAAWVHKGLPSFEEWEFAVRGSESRPSSFARIGAAPGKINFGDLNGQAWPVTQGDDVTPEGIRNLCSNVSEWTRRFEPEAGGRARPGTYAVGASFRDSIAFFYRAPLRPPDRPDVTIGFRCALSLQDVRGHMSNPETPPLIVSEK